jgi:hypothetical protein
MSGAVRTVAMALSVGTLALVACGGDAIFQGVSLEAVAARCQPVDEAWASTGPEERIRPHPANPCYWEYRGAPVLLLGASDQDNLFNHPDIGPDGLEAHLDLLVASGGNYVRNTMSSRDPGNVWPFARSEGGVHDLNRWNPEYWDRLEDLLRMTHDRDIVVQIEIWDRFDFAREPWDQNPFNPKNSLNYTAEASGLPEVIDAHPGSRENPFFRSVPSLDDNVELLEYQKAFVDRILSMALPYPHVLFTISNETNESPDWSEYWAHHVRARAREMGVEVHVTEMWDAWDLSDSMHLTTFSQPELYSYADISQNNHQVGQDHWDRAQWAIHNLISDPPRPVNSVKIYGGERHGGGFDEGTRKLWRNVFGGLASSRFHRVSDPERPSGLGLNSLARSHLRSLRALTEAMDVFRAVPRQDLLSDRDDDEAYAMAVEGREYAVYFPAGGSVLFDLTMASGPLAMRWLNILEGTWTQTEDLEGGEVVPLAPPGEGPWAALIRRAGEGPDDG